MGFLRTRSHVFDTLLTPLFIALQPCDDANSTRPPPLLDLHTGRNVAPEHVTRHPLVDHLLRIDDISGLEGGATSPAKFSPVDFLQIPERVGSFAAAVDALRRADHLLTKTENQAHAIKFTHFLKVGLLQHLFTQIVPLPLGPESRRKHPNTCIWDTDMTYGQQLDLSFILLRLMEHFAAAVCSLKPTKGFHAVRIVVAGAIAALIDAVLRREGTDVTSSVSLHLQVCCSW